MTKIMPFDKDLQENKDLKFVKTFIALFLTFLTQSHHKIDVDCLFAEQQHILTITIILPNT